MIFRKPGRMAAHSARYGAVGGGTGKDELNVGPRFLILFCDPWCLFNIAQSSLSCLPGPNSAKGSGIFFPHAMRRLRATPRPFGFVDRSALLLCCRSFNNKYAALRRAMTNRLDRIVCRRILPGLRFLHTIKLDHNESLRRFAFNGF